MTHHGHYIGAYVLGALDSPRALVRHADLLADYTDGVMLGRDEVREAYLSHFIFGSEMQAHYKANRGSVANYVGPCWARWLHWDIDRADDLGAALIDARRLVTTICERYPELDGDVPVYFSGSKGFDVALELSNCPPPSVWFHRVCRTFAEALAARAGVTIDAGIYDVVRPLRLPNTRHPKSGLFKRRIPADALFALDVPRILDLARHPSGDGMPTVRTSPPQLAIDWHDADQQTARAAEARAVLRRDAGTAPDTRAPRYFMNFLRFGADVGDRHLTLFRCAAWLTERKASEALVFALLTEPGCDVGLAPADVRRQIRCGIDHARRQRGEAGDLPPDPSELDDCERWSIEHEADPLPDGATDFPFGALAEREGGLG